MLEAQLTDSGSGLAPVTEGWFVVNVRDAEWWFTDTRHAACNFENENGEAPVEFAQFGINLTVLEPGQSNGFYHSESAQEAFLVLSGQCRLLVEGEERLLGPWDFAHCPPHTEHIFVGAGDGPCVILMAGTRSEEWGVRTRCRSSQRGTARAWRRRPPIRRRPTPRSSGSARAAAVLGSPSVGLTTPVAALAAADVRSRSFVPNGSNRNHEIVAL